MGKKQRGYTLKEAAIICGVLLTFLSMLLLYEVYVQVPQESICTTNGFLGISYSVYRSRRGFDLYVPVGDTEYFLEGSYIDRPIGELERDLNRMVTYGAEVTYVDGPNLKPYLLGLRVLGDEIIPFDEVYGNWLENERLTKVISLVCAVAGPLLLVIGIRMKDKKTGSE